MKKRILGAVCILLLLIGGCDQYASVEDLAQLENRVAALENLCGQMNTNISSLQTIIGALQNNDYITSVTPVTQNGETVGYTIAFTKSEPITIYHGKDGKNGADGQNGKDGKDGYTPVIGVRQDSDGVYYWTLDGSWMLDPAGNKIKAEGKDGADGKDGANGQDGANGKDGKDGNDGKDGKDGKDGVNGTDGKDGADGKNGADGKDGKDGKDGITPRLRITDGYWEISYDNGSTWERLGKATGENGANGSNGTNGSNGADGKDGDSFFRSVTVGSDCVTFVLADGQTFEIPFASKLKITFETNNLTIQQGDVLKVSYEVSGATGADSDIIVEALSTSDLKVMVYHDGTAGRLEIEQASASLDKYSKVIVLASDGSRTIMQTLTFEEMLVKVEEPEEGDDSSVSIGSEGEELVLEFYSNTDEYEVVIAEEDKGWIELISTKAMNRHSVTLRIKPNDGEEREAKVQIVTNKNHHTLDFGIKQKRNKDARDSYDLSSVETANCYMVEKEGTYSFDATTVGNGDKGIMPGYAFHAANAKISPVAARLLWQDGEIVSNITLQDGRVYFDASEERGNAVIAVMNADSTILWSWHIWATDKPKEIQLSATTHTYLDRNLGATSVQAGLPSSQGLFYQWGRKDPFRKDVNNKEVAPYPLTINHFVQNPEVMYYFVDNNGGAQWFENDAALWGNPDGSAFVATFKTIYDPCPPGYTIPSDAAWYEYGYGQIYETERYYSRIDTTIAIIHTKDGVEAIKAGKTIVYPCAEVIAPNNTTETGNSYYVRNGGSAMRVYESGVYVKGGGSRSWGASVRCVKEEPYQLLAPSIETKECTHIKVNDLVVNGDVIDNGNTPLQSVGFYWGLSQSEMTNRIEIKPASPSFSYHLENLPTNATVYVRAFAENAVGISYGDVKAQRLYSAAEYAAIAIDSLSLLMSKQYMQTQGLNGEGTIKTWYGNFGNDLQRCNQPSWANMGNHQLNNNSTSTYCIYPWYYYYKIIGKANQVIDLIDKEFSGAEIEKQFLKAQALTFRAHAFTMLAQLYCRRWSDGSSNPGLVLSLDAKVGSLTRATVGETFAQIYSDLNEAIALYQQSGKDRRDEEFYRPNLQVAYAVYTRAALIREDWPTVVRTAPLAREGHPLMSRSEYMDGGFSDKYGVPGEWIWGVHETEERTLYYYGFFAYQASDATSSMQRTYPLAISKELYEQIPETDARRKMWLAPTPEEWAACNAAGGAGTGALYRRAHEEYGNKLSTWGNVYGYMQFKFQATFLPGGGSFNIYRAAEMYLAEAEALCHIGGQDAKVQSLLNELNANLDDNYNCTKTGEDLLREVKLYRRIDLWGEGFDYYDYKRWNEPIVRKSIADGGSFLPSFAITINPEDGNHWTWVLPEKYETIIREGSIL